ncbi:MAG: dicarboxylate/amino acid:cation symporter [Gemmatimonadales bacterium]
MHIDFSTTDYRRHPVGAAVAAIMGLTAGFALGSVAHRTGGLLLQAQPFFDWFGRVWLNALVMISLPLVVALIVVAVLGLRQQGEAGKLGGLTLLWFMVFLVGAGLLTIVAGDAIIRWFPAAPTTRAAMASSLDHAATRAATPAPFGSWVGNLIPGNIFHALADGEVLPVIVATFLFAVAARSIAEGHRKLLRDLAQAVADASLALAALILRVLPVAVFAMAFAAATSAGSAVAGGVAYFVILCSLLLIIATVLLYPITVWLGRISLRRFVTAIWPCQVVALTTRSSIAALPSLLDRGESRIGLPASVSSFVLPLSVSVFKLNRTISSPLKVIVLSHLYGIPIDSGIKLTFVAIAALISFGTPGLPSGGTVVTLPFYLAAGLPLQGLMLLNAVDAIPDLFKTTLNVTGDMSVATIVTRFAGLRLAAAGTAHLVEPGASAVVA